MLTYRGSSEIARRVWDSAVGQQASSVDANLISGVLGFIPELTKKKRELEDLAKEMKGQVTRVHAYNEICVLLSTLKDLKNILTGTYTYHLSEPEDPKIPT